VELWLQNFLTAAFVVTDSFHGMLFSVIFNKPFIVFGNEKRGLSRFASFLKMIDLEDRLILVGKDIDNGIIDKNINFDAVNRVIANEKLNSNAYFNRHLK
jgi:exopolysaccharide biosynthesis predicted pyruvyltransferase EpsI